MGLRRTFWELADRLCAVAMARIADDVGWMDWASRTEMGMAHLEHHHDSIAA